MPPNAYGGFVDDEGNPYKAGALTYAMLLGTPILVNYVFKRPDLKAGEETDIFRIVNTLSPDQDQALTDCFQRMNSRLEKKR